ncbi:hypothetical protein [Nannocystis punicea]|uniref:Uncharacterized protein n=1 Tax=Nannocystis punicea TaxID=2995304 RepID=A0ABY7GXN9_9BACT|nr:hypothetical protein [Nannocystis poenicansa]WAS91584.1 hypothetical protein O0S08_35840 [Nannocystis poenicansa]
MLTALRSLAAVAATSLVVAACFNPTGQTTEATIDPSAPTDSSNPSTTDSDPTTTAPTTSATTVESTTDTTTLTTDVDPTVGPCAACDSPTPYCGADGCVGCQDLAASGQSCADLDPAAPHCDPGGECVACVGDEHCGPSLHCHPQQKICVPCLEDLDCGDTLSCVDGKCIGCTRDEQCPQLQPVCDPDTQICRSCRAHAECPETACELDVGTCFPAFETKHWYVDPGLPCADDAKCVLANECCTAAQAMNRAAAEPAAYHVLHVKPGVQTQPVELAIAGKRVALLGQPDVVFMIDSTEAVFSVGDGMNLQHLDSKLYVSRLHVTGGQTTRVVSCVDAEHLWLDEVDVYGVGGDALYATNCPLTVRRSSFRATSAGVTAAAGAVVHVENSIFGDTVSGAPLQTVNGGELDLLYTTVVDKGNGSMALLKCWAPAEVTIRNSILVGVGGEIQCADAAPTISHTVTTADGLAGPNITTVSVDGVPSLFSDYVGGNYHLGPDAGLLDHSAERQEGDPPVDIDGQPRPGDPGDPDFAGADRP